MKDVHCNVISMCIFSILFSVHNIDNWKGKSLTDQEILDQYQYLGNCPPTSPLTQQQSIDNNLGLMLLIISLILVTLSVWFRGDIVRRI